MSPTAGNRIAVTDLSNARGMCWIALAGLAITIMAVLVKTAGGRLHVVEILLVRQLVVVALLSPFLLYQSLTVLSTEYLKIHLVRIVLSAIAMLCGYTAIQHLELSEAIALTFSKNLFVGIFALVILGESLTRRRWLVLIGGFAGVLTIARPSITEPNWYVLVALCSAAAVGLTSVVIRDLSQREKMITVLSYQAFGVGILLLIPGVLIWKAPTLLEWICLIAAGLMSVLGQALSFAGFRAGQASIVTSGDYLQLVFATILGFIVFGEVLQISTIIGAGIIIVAACGALYPEGASHHSNSALSDQPALPRAERPLGDLQKQSVAAECIPPQYLLPEKEACGTASAQCRHRLHAQGRPVLVGDSGRHGGEPNHDRQGGQAAR